MSVTAPPIDGRPTAAALASKASDAPCVTRAVAPEIATVRTPRVRSRAAAFHLDSPSSDLAICGEEGSGGGSHM